ncbi:MAG: hypothetical protein AB7O52_03200 [Planctomycetota bacterium]
MHEPTTNRATTNRATTNRATANRRRQSRCKHWYGDRAVRSLALAGLLAVATSCYPSNVIEETGRQVVAELPSVRWQSAPPEFPTGLYESEQLTGDAAGALTQVYYYFGAPSGTNDTGPYSGAALVLGEAGPAFQVLAGVWTYRDGQLDLGDGLDPLAVQVAGDRLRLANEAGAITLLRQELR